MPLTKCWTGTRSSHFASFLFFFWQDANGKIGLTAAGIQEKPIEMLPGETVIKIASGGDHLLCLTEKGEIYSCGKEPQKKNL